MSGLRHASSMTSAGFSGASMEPIDERSRVVLAAFAALVAVGTAQLADLTTFVRMISIGGMQMEANPIVVRLVADHGLGAVLAWKVAMIPFVAIVVFALARIRSSRLAGTVLTIATLTGLVGALSNVLAVV